MNEFNQIDFNNKRTLIRADFNVPLHDKGPEQGEVRDDSRIKLFLPTLKAILAAGGKAILMSHFEDPPAKFDPAFSLRPVAKRLSEMLGFNVPLAPDCIGPEVEALVAQLEPGRAVLLENLRFNPGEKTNDSAFAAKLAALGEIYIDDAFAAMHRKHASICAVAAHFKVRAAGLLVRKELDFYERALVKPSKPLCVILGGAKVSSKLGALMNLADKADSLIIGGAMANTFLAAQGVQMGRSKYEPDLFPKVLGLLGNLARRGCKVYLPVDFIVAPALNSKGLGRAVTAQEMPADVMALDIGPATSLLFREALQSANTIIWNGPMGAFEQEDFSKGTTDMIESIASAHGLKVVGGGDTDAAIHEMQLEHKFDYVSSGGGAFLALLEGQGLPGVRALEGSKV